MINLDNLHWVCVANIGCPDNTVNIYDSLPAYSVGSKSLQKHIAAMLCTPKKFFELRFINVQLQCGVQIVHSLPLQTAQHSTVFPSTKTLIKYDTIRGR